jgi:hypothetical protein
MKGDRVGAKRLAEDGLKAGAQPLDLVLNGLVVGMNQLGDKYAKRLVGLPQLMLAANTFYGTMEVIKPHIKKAEDTINFLFSLDFDLKPFYERVKEDKIMTSLTSNLWGLKSPTTPTVFEAFAAISMSTGTILSPCSATIFP